MYGSADHYVQDFPEGAAYYNWIDRFQDVRILKVSDETDNLLPGGFVWAKVVEWHNLDDTTTWVVWVNDNDDGFMYRKCRDKDDAEFWLFLLTQWAPFSWSELPIFDFTTD